jgi:hypothetical protein
MTMRSINSNALAVLGLSAHLPWLAMLGVILPVIVGCTSGTGRLRSTVVCGTEWNKGRAMRIELAQVDGQYCSRSSTKLSPGLHTVCVAVTWSNGHLDRTDCQFEVLPGKWYWVLAYELAPQEPREKADVRMMSFSEGLARAGAKGALEGSAPLWFPVVAVYSGIKIASGQRSPPIRPGDGRCFVWIQERESEVVIAGERP